MKKLAAVAAALAALACNRERTYETPAPTASSDPAGTWVAQPSELSPEQIRLVQRALRDRGFAVEPSGTFDGATKVALTDFQRSRGLPETGNLNADTAASLGLDPAEVMPARGQGEATASGAEREPGTSPSSEQRPSPEPPPAGHPGEEPSPRVEPRY